MKLLPPNSSQLEMALEQVLTADMPVDAAAQNVWNPWNCPLALLPWLAWAVGVDEWDANWPEDVKRRVIAAAPEIRRHRGTVWAVREALRAAGYGDSVLIEGLPVATHNGNQVHDGADTYSGAARWAHFRVITELPDDQSVAAIDISRALRLIDRAKNVRSVLNDFGFRCPTISDTIAAPTDAVTLAVAHSVTDSYALTVLYNGRVAYSGAVHYGRDSASLLISAASRHDGSFNYDADAMYSGRADTAIDF